MSTNAIVGYRGYNGEFRGTYVHNDGDEVAVELHRLFKNDAHAMRKWVERGILGEDYSSASSAPYEDPDNATENMPYWTIEDHQSVNYVWEISEYGAVLPYGSLQ